LKALNERYFHISILANSLYENEFAKVNGFSAASITGGGGYTHYTI
jgi:hypothetical protein